MRPERNQFEAESNPNLQQIIDHHIVQQDIRSDGNVAGLNSLNGSVIGVKDSSIDRPNPALDVLSMPVMYGSTLVLIGPNGSGKSTLFDAVMSRNNADFGLKNGSGAIKFDRSKNPTRDGLRIARLDQEEILKPIRDMKAGEVLERVANHFKDEFKRDWATADYGEDDAVEKIEFDIEARSRIDALKTQLVEFLEMRDFMDRTVSELSGGEKTKLSLIMLFMSEPDVVLLDEPTNHLDLVTISKLIALFKKYNNNGVSIVCSSHVPWFLDEVGQGGVLEINWDEKGRRLSHSSSPYSKYKKDGSRRQEEIMSGKIEWRNDFRVHNDAMFHSPNSFTVPNSPLINVKSLPSIRAKDVVVLTGKNGTGKSRLLQVLAENKENNGLPKRMDGLTIGYLPQSWPEEVSNGTVLEFFEWIRSKSNPNDSEGLSKFKKQINSKGFGKGKSASEILNIKLSNFSGGEQRLLWFIAASSIKLDMLILDEPTNHMDNRMQLIITEAIRDFPGGVLVSTHDKNLMTSFAAVSGELFPNVSHWDMEKENGKTKLEDGVGNMKTYLGKLTEQANSVIRKVKI